MKKILPVFLLITISFFAHGQENIAGSWKVNLDHTLERMRAEVKVGYDTLPAQVKQRISQAFNNREFTFQPDGVVTIQWERENNLQRIQGTWNYDAPANRLTVTTDTNQVTEFEVKTFTSSILILEMIEAGGIFQELYLTKI